MVRISALYENVNQSAIKLQRGGEEGGKRQKDREGDGERERRRNEESRGGGKLDTRKEYLNS